MISAPTADVLRRNGTAPAHLHMKPLKRLRALPLFCIIFQVFLSKSMIFPSLFTKSLQFFTPRYQDDRCPYQGFGQRGSMPTTRVSLLQQHHIFSGINLAGASAGVYTQSPASTNPAACSCWSAEHRTRISKLCSDFPSKRRGPLCACAHF